MDNDLPLVWFDCVVALPLSWPDVSAKPFKRRSKQDTKTQWTKMLKVECIFSDRIQKI